MNGPSFSISGRPVGYDDQKIINGVPFWPDLFLGDFQKSRTIPADVPAKTTGRALLNALGEINKTLAPVVTHWTARGCQNAADVPGATLEGESENQITAQYITAVYARAKADLIGEFASIGRRQSHPGQESEDTRASLLAEAAYVVRNMLDLPRVGVHLI